MEVASGGRKPPIKTGDLTSPRLPQASLPISPCFSSVE